MASVIASHLKTSGGGRWSYLAAGGDARRLPDATDASDATAGTFMAPCTSMSPGSTAPR